MKRTNVITFTLPLMKSQVDKYPCIIAYVKGFQWPDRRWKPSIDWTPNLHEAITYADGGAAHCIKEIINRVYADAEVLNVSEKEIFKAKLTGR